MKRIIKSSTSIKASLVPPEYTKLAQSLRAASKAIDECVDHNLNGYIDWDMVQKFLRAGMEAISKAGHDIEENHVENDDIFESTYVKSSTDDNLVKVVKSGEDFYELEGSSWYKCLRMTSDEYEALPEEVKDIIDNYALYRGTDGDGNAFIDVGGPNMYSVSSEDRKILVDAGVHGNNNELEKVMLQELF